MGGGGEDSGPVRRGAVIHYPGSSCCAVTDDETKGPETPRNAASPAFVHPVNRTSLATATTPTTTTAIALQFEMHRLSHPPLLPSSHDEATYRCFPCASSSCGVDS